MLLLDGNQLFVKCPFFPRMEECDYFHLDTSMPFLSAAVKSTQHCETPHAFFTDLTVYVAFSQSLKLCILNATSLSLPFHSRLNTDVICLRTKPSVLCSFPDVSILLPCVFEHILVIEYIIAS